MIRSLLCLTAATLIAQGPPPAKPSPETLKLPPMTSSPVKELVRADLSAEETGSPQALLNTLYAFISGPKDEARDLEKIRALFHLQSRIMVTAKHPEKGTFLRPLELEAFLAFALPQWKRTGFYEKGTAAPTIQAYEGLAQVWSPYEIRLVADGPVLYTGVNALQCAFDGKRWWITHLQFQSAPTAALDAMLAAQAKEAPTQDAPKPDVPKPEGKKP